MKSNFLSKNYVGQCQYIVILGTAQYDGVPSRILAARCDHGVELAHFLPQAQVISVGGNLPGDRFTEAGVIKDYLLNRNISANRIQAIETGSDTRGSLQAIDGRVPDIRKNRPQVVIVTDPTHRLRTWLLARQLGWKIRISPTPGCPTVFPRPSWWHSIAHEFGGLVVLAVGAIAGHRQAERVREILHRIEGRLRPTRKARHEFLRSQRKKS